MAKITEVQTICGICWEKDRKIIPIYGELIGNVIKVHSHFRPTGADNIRKTK